MSTSTTAVHHLTEVDLAHWFDLDDPPLPAETARATAAKVLQQGTLEPFVALRGGRAVARLCSVRQGGGKIVVSWPEFAVGLPEGDEGELLAGLLLAVVRRHRGSESRFLEFKMTPRTPHAEMWETSLFDSGFVMTSSSHEFEEPLDKLLPEPETPGVTYTDATEVTLHQLEETFLACHIDTADRVMSDEKTDLKHFFHELCSIYGAEFDAHVSLVAWAAPEEGGPSRPVGVGIASMNLADTPRIGWLSVVVVHPSVRKKRLGSALSCRVINRMKAAGADFVRVLIDEVNLASMKMQKAVTGHRLPGWHRTYRLDLQQTPTR